MPDLDMDFISLKNCSIMRKFQFKSKIEVSSSESKCIGILYELQDVIPLMDRMVDKLYFNIRIIREGVLLIS